MVLFSLLEAVTQMCSVNRCSWKFHKIHRKTPVPESLLLKKRLRHRCFPVIFVNFPITLFFLEHLRLTASALHNINLDAEKLLDSWNFFPKSGGLSGGHYTILLIEFDFLISRTCVMAKNLTFSTNRKFEHIQTFQLIENDNKWIVFGMEGKTW